MAARSGSQGRVAVLDVRHELQIVFAQRPGCVDELQAHLSGEAEGCRVDLDNPGHARHVKEWFHPKKRTESANDSFRSHEPDSGSLLCRVEHPGFVRPSW